MKLVETSILKPVSVAVGVIFVVLFGLISLFKIPVQLTPDVEKPRITVDTTWIGGSPTEVETEIVREQEDELKTVKGLVEMTSESSDGRGSITLEFLVGTDIDAALVDVSNKLEQVKEYPSDADRPVISNVDVRASAIAWFILKPLKGNEVDICFMTTGTYLSKSRVSLDKWYELLLWFVYGFTATAKETGVSQKLYTGVLQQ